ncbi:MAG: metal ABC transporter substrate-binding protein, partial [Planctomycetes bacterium]|nr:metal ABC transporter substrate-binding protein [Planctomycetota bacterium]
PAALEKTSNPRIAVGSAGYVNIGRLIQPLEIPISLSRANGNVHPMGNPHFNIDPDLGRVMCAEVRDALIAADPGRRSIFESNWEVWDQALAARQKIWADYLKPLRGKPLVSYHRSWSYFAKRYGFELIGELEPVPGLRPSPKHLAELASKMQEAGAKVILMEPWYPRSDVEKLMKFAEAEVVVLCTTCGYTSKTGTYMNWIDHLVDQVGQAYGRPPLAEFAESQRARASGM